MRFFCLIILFFSLVTAVIPQSVTSVIPDTGTQGNSFQIIVHSTGTEFTLSPYWVINFDSLGVETNSSSVVTLNDTTLTAFLFIDGQASTGYHKCIVADQYSNIYTKDSAFLVFLNLPTVPLPLLPSNNSTNVSNTPYFLWDSNRYANTYRIQISSDSTFAAGTIVFDTVLSGASLTLRSGILNYDTRYFWKLNATNTIGTSLWSTVFKFKVKPIGITNISTGIPSRFVLFPNYPNPFNAETRIRFELPLNGNAVLRIFDVNGKEIAKPVDMYFRAGSYEYKWNAGNLASGVYFYLMETSGFRDVRKAVIIK